MQQSSRIIVALIIVLVATGAGLAYLAFVKRPAALEASSSSGTFDTVVGDETPFTPEW